MPPSPVNLHLLQSALGGREEEAILLILGSGMSQSFNESEYEIIGEFPSLTESTDGKTVQGHLGVVALWSCDGIPILLSLGRRHLYEGVPLDQLTTLIRWAGSLGVRKLLLTNAAGGLNPRFSEGDCMLHRGYLPTLLGRHRSQSFGQQLYHNFHSSPSVPVQSSALLDKFADYASSEGVRIEEGVYAGVTGPNYETVAEIRMLRRMGADAVGMSTITEVEEGIRWGMKRLGFSLITNVLSDTRRRGVSHEEVTDVAASSREHLRKLLEIGVRVLAETE
ncbi:MAG: purine-nucleoside phosphorylase [Candidatus Kapaibacterium sp.]